MLPNFAPAGARGGGTEHKISGSPSTVEVGTGAQLPHPGRAAKRTLIRLTRNLAIVAPVSKCVTGRPEGSASIWPIGTAHRIARIPIRAPAAAFPSAHCPRVQPVSAGLVGYAVKLSRICSIAKCGHREERTDHDAKPYHLALRHHP